MPATSSSDCYPTKTFNPAASPVTSHSVMAVASVRSWSWVLRSLSLLVAAFMSAALIRLYVSETLLISPSISTLRPFMHADNNLQASTSKPHSRELMAAQGGERRRSKLYHSSFDIWSTNYDLMFGAFKVFIYPPGESGNYSFEAASRGSHRTVDFFFSRLSESDFVTLDPEEATFFMLPISVHSLWRSPAVGSERLGRHLKGYIQVLRTSYPYWNRSLGADHALIACHDFPPDTSRNFLELKKNSVWIDCFPFPKGGHPNFYPHKDITMPSASPAPAAMQEPLRGISGRTTLVYYAGDMETEDLDETESDLMQQVYKAWKDDADFLFVETWDENSSREAMLSSRFCLATLSQGEDIGLLEMLQSGCVPVLITDHLLYEMPFQDIANWQKFAVIVHPKQTQDLKNLLQAITPQDYEEMQQSGADFAVHLGWHNPPEPMDAFFMLCYQLWMRRGSIRYIDRS